MYAKLFYNNKSLFNNRLLYNNLKKTFKEYSIYFCTLIISSTLFFAFLSLASRYNDILDGDGNYSLSLFQNTIRYAVLAISVIFLALIRYINTFMLKQRSREFAVYMVLGMEQKMIARQFFGETFLFGMAAVGLGCICGTALSGVMTTFVMRTMISSYSFRFGFYPDTMMMTLLFFSISFLIVGFGNVRKIHKMKLINLLHEKRVSEGQQKKKRSYLFFLAVTVLCFGIVSVTLYSFANISGIYAGDIPVYISNRYQAVSIVAAIIGIFALYHTVAFVLVIIRHGGKWKNRNMNLVLLGNLYQKISSTANILSVSTLAITVSLTAFVIMPIMAEITTGYLKYRMPYDIMINNSYHYIDEMSDIPHIDFGFVRDILEKYDIALSEEVTQESYFIWERDFNTVSTREHWRDLPRLTMSISDYNTMREMAGFESVILEDNHFFMHIDYERDKESIETGITTNQIQLDDGTILTLADTAVYNEPMGQYLFHMDGSVLVFPDAVCNNLLLARTCYYANAEQEIPYRLCGIINDEIIIYFKEHYSYLYEKYETKYRDDKNYTDFIEPIRFRTKENNDVALTATSVRLLGIYSGVVFFIICMTVLALQSITDCIDHRLQYRNLYWIGVEENDIMKMVRKQSFLYFFSPCLAAFMIALLLIYSFVVRYGYKVYTYVGSVGFQFGVLIPGVLIVLILVCYYSVTMYTIRKNLIYTLKTVV